MTSTSLSVVLAVAAITTAAVPALAEERFERAGVAAQLSALGLDPVAVRAEMQSLTRVERLEHLATLGVVLPEAFTRPEVSLPAGEVRPLAANAVRLEVKDLAALEGAVQVIPMERLPGIVVPPVLTPGGAINDRGQVIVLPAPIDGANFTPARPLPAAQ